MSDRRVTALLLAAVVLGAVGGSGASAPPAIAAWAPSTAGGVGSGADGGPWSMRLGSFRYLESADAFAGWLLGQGVSARVVQRHTDTRGRWLEVHAGAAWTRAALAPEAARLAVLGFGPPTADDRRLWEGAWADVAPTGRGSLDDARAAEQVGEGLFRLSRALPCHPRFELLSLAAARLEPGLSEEGRAAIVPAGLHPTVIRLADTADGAPLLARARLRDLVTGTELAVSMVWREPMEDPSRLGPATRSLDRAEGTWSSRPVVDHGANFAGGHEAVWLAWSDRGEQVAVVTADGAGGWSLVPILFDRTGCSGGAFDHPAMSRPLAALPRSWEPGDEPVALAMGLIGEDYASDKDTDWARRMTGRGEFVAWHRTPSGALWSTSVFDLESSDDAAQVHDGLYGASLRAAYGTRAMRRARARGWDAVYRAEVHGRAAWYIDLGRGAHHKELNFVAGPLIFAFGSYVLDDRPLRMKDLVRRAEHLPGLRQTR